MAGPRQPIELIIANGKKNLSKAEIAERRASEVAPCMDEIVAPEYLTEEQTAHFIKLAEQLKKIKIMGETDCDTLARYVVAESLYEQAVEDLRVAHMQRPQNADAEELMLWAAMIEKMDKRQDRYCKQASTMARDLGLTISSRCKLQVPVKNEPEKPVNKFARFGGKAAGSE
jgi:P27 family predicted phage terminase small subunit